MFRQAAGGILPNALNSLGMGLRLLPHLFLANAWHKDDKQPKWPK
jgi:hypothetical protein